MLIDICIAAIHVACFFLPRPSLCCLLARFSRWATDDWARNWLWELQHRRSKLYQIRCRDTSRPRLAAVLSIPHTVSLARALSSARRFSPDVLRDSTSRLRSMLQRDRSLEISLAASWTVKMSSQMVAGQTYPKTLKIAEDTHFALRQIFFWVENFLLIFLLFPWRLIHFSFN